MTLDDLKKASKDKKRELPKAKDDEIICHLFKNGYIINEGEFNDADDPANEEFLK